MAWVRIEPEVIDHPKIIGLSDSAFALHIRAICYCNRHLTDGSLPSAALKNLGKKRAASDLVSAGLWSRDADGNYHIHDYLEYQPSRQTVTERRSDLSEIRAEAGRIGATKRWQTDSKRDSKPIAKQQNENSKTTNREWQSDSPDPDPVVQRDLNTPPISPPDGKTQRLRFDEWWARYPRRVGKQQAWRIWERLKPNDGLFARMLGVLALQVTSVDWQRDGGKFIPHPSTYLHQGRYEDDVPVEPMLPPAMEAYRQYAQWDWCEACDDAHEVGKCPKAQAKAS